MATAPYRIIDRRSSSGYVRNDLIETATQTPDREYVQPVDDDIHKVVSTLGRRTLMTLGRNLFWRFAALQGMVLEQANLAVSSYLPQFAGADKAWGKLAESMLNDWHKVMDIAGWPFDWDSFLQTLVIGPLIDGEVFTLLTETPEGYPLIQMIPAHRIGRNCPLNSTVKVRYQGNAMLIDGVTVDSSRPYPADPVIDIEARVVDGVVLDDYTRPIAYRLDGEDGATQYLPARNIFPSFCPMVPGQVRGFSVIAASSAFDFQDIHEWKKWEMLAQKMFSTRTIIEHNENGEDDAAKSVIKNAATYSADGKKTGLDVQRLYAGTIQYFKAGSGSKIEAFGYDRPGGNSREFLKTTLRDAFRGTEWDVFFSLDPQAVGGAPMRVIVDKINAVLEKRRRLVKKAALRVDGYALSKFMQLGLLPWNDEWYRWDYQGPGEVTADKKYDSDVDLQEIREGISTRKRACAARGLDVEAVDEQRELETDRDLTVAGRLAKKHGISIQEALAAYRQPAGATSSVSTSVLPDDPKAPAPATDPNQ